MALLEIISPTDVDADVDADSLAVRHLRGPFVSHRGKLVSEITTSGLISSWEKMKLEFSS